WRECCCLARRCVPLALGRGCGGLRWAGDFGPGTSRATDLGAPDGATDLRGWEFRFHVRVDGLLARAGMAGRAGCVSWDQLSESGAPRGTGGELRAGNRPSDPA